MKHAKLLIGLAAIAMIVALGWIWHDPAGLKNSPDITLLTLDGERLSLATLRGKPLLLVFWATSCPACLEEMPHLIELYDELSPQGFELIAVAMRHDKPVNVLAMRKERNIPYPVALDLDGGAALAFGNIRLTPTSFLVAPNGRIVMKKTGKLDMQILRDRITAMLQQAATVLPDAADKTLGS